MLLAVAFSTGGAAARFRRSNGGLDVNAARPLTRAVKPGVADSNDDRARSVLRLQGEPINSESPTERTGIESPASSRMQEGA